MALAAARREIRLRIQRTRTSVCEVQDRFTIDRRRCGTRIAAQRPGWMAMSNTGAPRLEGSLMIGVNLEGIVIAK